MTKRIEQDTSWMNEAACVGADPNLFYHTGRTPEVFKAKQICDSCPVKGQCLEFDLAAEHQWGTWGGVEQEERRKIKNRQNNVGRSAVRNSLPSAS